MINLYEAVNIVINTVFTIMSVKVFFDLFLEPKKWEKSYVISILFICIWNILLIVEKYPIPIVILMSITLITIYALQMYNGNIFVKIGFSVLYATAWVLIEFLIGYVFLIMRIDIVAYSLWGSIISKLFTIGLICVFRYLKQISRISTYTPKNIWIILITPVISLVLMYIVFNNNLKKITKVDLQLSLALACSLLFANIVVLKVYQLLIREIEANERHARFVQQKELTKEHSEEIELMLNDIRKLNHNIKNHFITLRGYLENNQIRDAIQYLNELNNEKWNKESICNTGNVAIDTIINTKYLKICKYNIKFKVSVNIPAAIQFLGVDLSVLIGNILENAIEANLRLFDEEKYINLYIKYENNYLILSCINSFNGEISKNNFGIIETTKKNKSNHGFGSESIKNICEKYDGKMTIDCINNTFVIKCLLFIFL